ncbi:MAG: type II secretion system protein [Burkholderiaceae bacterium]
MKQARCLRSAQRGFTLMELVVTLSLLGLMAMLAAPLAELSVQRAREQELRIALREIRLAIDHYKAASDQGLIERKVGDSGYPPDIDTLASGVRNQKSPGHEPMFFLRRIPRDPFAAAEGVPNSATWGLRSYASSAQSPSAGADVFDVHTRSTAVGLNGLPYREW